LFYWKQKTGGSACKSGYIAKWSLSNI